MKIRIVGLTVIVVLTAAATVLLMLGRTDYDVGFDAAVEIWADVARDADFIGLTLTRVSAADEMEIGREITRDISFWSREGVDQELQDYVEAVGRILSEGVVRKDIEYHFHVIDAPYVNAFAIPGGGVFITTGMLDFLQSEAELAAILGHEISHIDLRHCIERLQYELAARKVVGSFAAIIRLAHELVGVGYSEQQELEADRQGVLLSVNAGYDSMGGVDVFERLARSEINERWQRAPPERPRLISGELLGALWDALGDYFASHPATPGRGRALVALIRRNAAETLGRELYVGRSNYVDHVPRSVEEREDEWVRYNDIPQLIDCELAPGVYVPTRTERC